MTGDQLTNHRLELGEIVVTPIIATFLNDAEINILLERHQFGDWGNIGHINSIDLSVEELIRNRSQVEEEAQINLVALIVQDGSILSEFMIRDKLIWIYTQLWGRNRITTVLTPHEY